MFTRGSVVYGFLLVLAGVYCEDDYFYDEQPEELENLHVPKFTTESMEFSVMVGETVTLPCSVDKLGATLIIWKADKEVYFTANIKQKINNDRIKLQDAGPTGNKLVISNVTANDSRTYECQITSQPAISLQHTVHVMYPPMVETTPENGLLILKKGSPAKLSCQAKGYPQPGITWTKKEGLLPYGDKKTEGDSIEIAAVEPAHLGTYQCTADNGVGKAVVESIRLEVTYPPEIKVVYNKVHTGAGYEAQIMCKVHGQPLPKVTWSRADGTALRSGHHVERQDQDMFSLLIENVEDQDLGHYICSAKNTLGKAEAVIEVTGKPTPVVVTSAPNGEDTTSYKLQMTVESYAQVQDYKIIYKMSRSNSSESSGKGPWEEAVVSVPQKDAADGVLYKYSYDISDLKPATIYEAIITAKNKYGWSDEPQKTFRFSTLGAQGVPADLKGVNGEEALGSTDPSSATRTGITTLLAAISAALVVIL